MKEPILPPVRFETLENPAGLSVSLTCLSCFLSGGLRETLSNAVNHEWEGGLYYKCNSEDYMSGFEVKNLGIGHLKWVPEVRSVSEQCIQKSVRICGVLFRFLGTPCRMLCS